jgi:hypothetical protein
MTHQWPSDEALDVVIRGGCVRLGPPGPYLHVGTNHGAIGIVDVDVNAAGDLVVTTDFQPGEELITASAAIDFQLAAKRVMCGVLGGGVTSTIRFIKPDGSKAKANSSFFDPDTDNIWFQTISAKPTVEPPPPP